MPSVESARVDSLEARMNDQYADCFTLLRNVHEMLQQVRQLRPHTAAAVVLQHPAIPTVLSSPAPAPTPAVEAPPTPALPARASSPPTQVGASQATPSVQRLTSSPDPIAVAPRTTLGEGWKSRPRWDHDELVRPQPRRQRPPRYRLSQLQPVMVAAQ
eukprot:3865789-Pleurochrysis_carterae.AAC.2